MGEPDDDTIGRFIRFGIRAAMLSVFAVAAFSGGTSKRLPENNVVFGCYSAENAPAIRLDADGLAVENANFASIPFRIERSKLGYSIETARALALDDSGDFPRLIVENEIGGVYLRFYRYDGQRSYGVFELNGPTPFQILGERSHLNYRPTTAARCRR